MCSLMLTEQFTSHLRRNGKALSSFKRSPDILSLSKKQDNPSIKDVHLVINIHFKSIKNYYFFSKVLCSFSLYQHWQTWCNWSSSVQKKKKKKVLCEINLFIFPNCFNLDKLLQMLLIWVTNTQEFITSSRLFSLLADEQLQRKQLQDTRMALQELSGIFINSFSKLREIFSSNS